MKKWFKVAGLALFTLSTLLAGVILFVLATTPAVGPPRHIKVPSTPRRLQRGRYLATAVIGCVGCHARRDWRFFSGPMRPNTEGIGGEVMLNRKMGFPGQLYAPNITPLGLKDWTDGELLRAFTEGVNRRGEGMFPYMLYTEYGKLTDEDARSILVYIKTLPPQSPIHPIPQKQIPAPIALFMRTLPRPAHPSPTPRTAIEKGRYLAHLAGCMECHTPTRMTRIDRTQLGAGGRPIPLPSGAIVHSANITPDIETGLGRWTETQFVNRFQAFRDPSRQRIPVPKDGFNTLMAWTAYAKMTTPDLKAIYRYLRSLKPIRRSTPPTNDLKKPHLPPLERAQNPPKNAPVGSRKNR